MSLTRAQLPVRLTPLVGRARELDDIVHALHGNRLITLTGPGGAGKTRLALAAAKTAEASFSSTQLAERMDDIFAVLVGGARSAPLRHQALRATLDWSYDLLDGDERATFRRLATFSGGFTLQAAERIAAGGDIRPGAMLELLTRLADKSLLRVDLGASRYSLLATIRDYARDRLAEAGESDQARRAHLRYFTELVEGATARIEQVQPVGSELDRLDAELPNLRRAFEFAQESRDPVAQLRIAGPLDRYAYLRGRYHEVRQWMDAAVTSSPDAPAGLRAKALLGGGRLALLQCDYAPAVRRLEAALRLYRELGDPRGTAGSLQVLGSVAREQGRYARAVELHAESLAIAEAAGDRWPRRARTVTWPSPPGCSVISAGPPRRPAPRWRTSGRSATSKGPRGTDQPRYGGPLSG